MALQKKRYGEMDDKIVLFPGALHKTMKKMYQAPKDPIIEQKSRTIMTTNSRNKSFATSPRVKKSGSRGLKRFSTEPNTKNQKLFNSFFGTGTL